jgi:hypothetical protein
MSCYPGSMLKSGQDKERMTKTLVRLRRIERSSDSQTRRELTSAIACLEDVVGSTVRRAEAARLLGISQTALDQWIKKGEIPVVATPSGRYEVPLRQLVDLLEQVDDHRGAGQLAVASVIRERRCDAQAIGEQELLPPRRKRPRTHRGAELRALAYHRLVAQKLDERCVDDARWRLRKLRDEGRIRPHWAEEWERILDTPIPQITRLISSDSPRGRELRQTSPFAGALNEQERRRALRVVEERLKYG